MKRILAAFAAVLGTAAMGAALPAGAQTSNSLGASTTADPMIYNFDYENVAPLLTAYGYEHQQGTMNGNQVYRVAKDGIVTLLAPTACRDQGTSDCVGLAMLSVFQVPLSETLNNEFNNTTFFLHAENQGNVSVLERYLISDFGFSKKSLEVELAVFAAVTVAYDRFRSGYMQTVDFEAGETMASADSKIGNSRIGNGAGNGVANGVIDGIFGEDGSREHVRAIAISAFPDAYNNHVSFDRLIDE